ncbi:MAG TPA: hypothetical protein VGB42_08325 [Candidatus Thermoplasmatota archaeon]
MPSDSVKGAIGQRAFDSLMLLLSGGALRPSPLVPDDAGVDRVLVRLGSPRTALIQVKTRTTLDRGRYLGIRMPAIRDWEVLASLYILGAQLMPRSPWVGRRVAFIPATELPPPPPSGKWSFRVPMAPGSSSRFAPFVHDLPELATVASRALDGGPAYPWPPPGGAARWVKRLTTTTVGTIMENEAACAIASHSTLPLNAWAPLVDDFGQDFSFTDQEHAAALRLQPKGAFGVQPDGQMRIMVRRRTFRPDPFCFLLFMHYDAAALRGPEYMHLVRADEFEKLAVRGKGFLLYNGRPQPGSKDKWRPWLYRFDEVAGVLETALGARKAGWELPARREDVMRVRRALGVRRPLSGVGRPRRRGGALPALPAMASSGATRRRRRADPTRMERGR